MRTRHTKAAPRSARINLSVVKRRTILLICILTAVITLIMVLRVTSSAHNTYTAEVCYTSAYINDGDTLWNIASDNYSREYGSFSDYLDEIRSLNHLSEDVIHSGEFLIVPVVR